MTKRLLVAAAAAGFLTGFPALTGHLIGVVIHGIGGALALALVVIVARRTRALSAVAVVVGMLLAVLTGVVWTVYGGTDAVATAHVLTGVFVSAGTVLLALEQ